MGENVQSEIHQQKSTAVKVKANLQRVAGALNSLRQQGILCDVLLKVNEHSLPAHSCLLSACSMYCYNLFTKDRPRPYSECVPQVIEFRVGSDTTSVEGSQAYFKALCNVVDFFYGGKLEINDENYINIETLASQLQAEDVVHHCKEYLQKKTNNHSVKTQRDEVSDEDGAMITSESIDCEQKQLRRIFERPRAQCNYDLRVLKRKRKHKISPKNETPVTGQSSPPREQAEEEAEEDQLMPDISGDLSDHDPYDEDDENEDGSLQCRKCAYLALSSEELKEHRLSHYGRPYVCVICGFRVKKPQSMLQHLREENHGETECSLCNYLALSKDELYEHLKLHDGDKPFFCTICNYRFVSNTALKLHMTKHVSDRPYICGICHKGFKIKYSLQSHMIVHSTQKPYLCDECGFSTAYKRSLEEHKLVHTGDTLKCQFFGCTFQTTKKSNLNQHMLTHSKEKPHQCAICGHAFALPRGLRRHMLTHAGAQSMIHCTQCPYASPRADKVKAHIKKRHPSDGDVTETPTSRGMNPKRGRPPSTSVQIQRQQDEQALQSSIASGQYTTIEVSLGDGTIIRTIALDASQMQAAAAGALKYATTDDLVQHSSISYGDHVGATSAVQVQAIQSEAGTHYSAIPIGADVIIPDVYAINSIQSHAVHQTAVSSSQAHPQHIQQHTLQSLSQQLSQQDQQQHMQAQTSLQS